MRIKQNKETIDDEVIMKSSNEKEKFIEYTVKHGIGTNSGNYRVCNAMANKISKITERILLDKEYACKFIDEILLENPDPSTILWLSVISAKVDYRKKEFIEILQKISNDYSLKLIACSAHYTLEVFFNEKIRAI